ncbi:neuronal acetylcholine receptor subunit beta-2-like [Maniola hyperantus]|uniref:neuronal acetylcholine receptor subunit beta-2-like n=1 Tax=Aphantopus hyperantus TaxID=2795564 RepID=UPI001569408C|nr:neuronal acetylcholine receptor subunit beta-2-like [Maniola hyperantus]
MLLVTIILVFLINLTMNCVIDHRSKETIVEQRLQGDLLKDYLGSQPPCSNITTVKLRFVLKYFYFAKNEEFFCVYTWTFFTWNDPRLAWKPEDYDNLELTVMQAIFLWRPQASFKNVNDLNDQSVETEQSSTYCQVKSNGDVSCALQQYHVVFCKTKLDSWPYDIQSCSFQLIPECSETIMKYRDHRVLYSFTSKKGLRRRNTLSYGPGWNIANTNCSIIEVNGTSIQLDFLIQRQALGFATIVIIPSIVLIIFTLSLMFLDVRCCVRIMLASLSLISHFTLLEIISVFIPRLDYNTPLILRFICSSIFITTCVIVLSIALNLLLKKHTKPLTKVVAFNKLVFETRLRYLIFPKWRVVQNEDIGDSSVMEIWTDFASILNSLFLHTFVVVYLILYCVFMPQPTKI